MNATVKLRALDAFNACELGMATVPPHAEFEAPAKVAADLVKKGLAKVISPVVEDVQPKTLRTRRQSPALDAPSTGPTPLLPA